MIKSSTLFGLRAKPLGQIPLEMQRKRWIWELDRRAHV